MCVHSRFATFDTEKWRLLTMTCGHFDHPTQYTGLFAASCGSFGEFIDIKKYDDGYAIPPRMRDYNFPLRRLNGDLYAQVFPFDPFFFYIKVHPNGALLFAPFHSQLTLLQHLWIQLDYSKKPLQLLSDVPKYWLEEDGVMCPDESHRRRSEQTL